MPQRSCPQKLLFQVCSSRAARPLFHLSCLSRPRSPAPRRFKGSCTHCCSPSTTIVIKLPPIRSKVSLPTWNGLLISNVLLQGRRRHRSAQYECSAPNNTTYFLRFEASPVQFSSCDVMTALSPCSCDNRDFVSRSSCSEGEMVTIHRGRVILQLDGLKRYDPLGEKRKCNIYRSVFLLMKSRHQ